MLALFGALGGVFIHCDCDSIIRFGRKPEPAIYEFACKSNGLSPKEVVFLDDLGL